MADTRSDDSASGTDDTVKEEILSRSTSASPLSSPKYRFRSSTTPTCVFGGKRLCGGGSSSSTSTNVRGPSTSTWGSAHSNRLNFSTIRIATEPEFFGKAGIKTALQEELIRVLLEPLADHDGNTVTAPDIVTTAIRKSLTEACLEKDPVVEYMQALDEDMRRKKIKVKGVTEKDIQSFENYMDMQAEQKTRTVKPSNLSEVTIQHFHMCFLHIFNLCALRRTSELELDHMISSVMFLIQVKEGWLKQFMISKRDETRIQFDICGSQVTSDTNVLWKYKDKNDKRNDKYLLTPLNGYPIVMSENKSQLSEKGIDNTKPSGFRASKTTAAHKKVSQVIGQCVSMADKSPFETENYKIVYHVSLMGTSELVVTRTHVAKSTLKVIKEGCEIPPKNDLDPSYVFEASFPIHTNVPYVIFFVYTPILILGKLSRMIFHPPQNVERKRKGVFTRKGSSKVKKIF